MQRIDDALNGPIENALIEKVEEAEDLTNAEANRIYKPEADRGATGTQFKKIVLTPHAQYRMDLRGITLSQIRWALKGFHDHYSREKSRGSFIFRQLESELQFTREIKWVDKASGITLVFVAMSVGGAMGARIITCYRAGEDEDRIDRSECGIFQGWAGDYEDTSNLFKPDSKRVLAMARLADDFPGGIKTFGDPNSGNGTNETLSVPTRDSPAADRDIPNFESTKPENVPHRTNSLPGEEAGNPVNDSNADGGMLTRRTMTGVDKEAWRRQWQSGNRRHRQHGQAKAKARAYYRRNKSKIRAKARIRHNRMKNNGAFKASERMRRRQNRHMISSLMNMVTPETVVAQFLYEKEAAKFAPVTERGGRGGQRQREQLPQEKLQDHREYLRGKGRKKHDALVYYKQKCKPNSRCMKRRERVKEDPKRYERGAPQVVREASVLTAPDIAFTLGEEVSLGYVHDLSPMTGLVTYLMDRNGTETLESMTVEVFLRVAFFLSEADIDAFFDLVDAELGDEAYEFLSHEGVQECAEILGIDPESPEFQARCRDYVGEDLLLNMTVDQLDAIQESMVSDLIDGVGGSPHDSAEDLEDEEDLIDDDENIYGIPDNPYEDTP